MSIYGQQPGRGWYIEVAEETQEREETLRED
jgi:hypothetical protein